MFNFALTDTYVMMHNCSTVQVNTLQRRECEEPGYGRSNPLLGHPNACKVRIVDTDPLLVNLEVIDVGLEPEDFCLFLTDNIDVAESAPA